MILEKILIKILNVFNDLTNGHLFQFLSEIVSYYGNLWDFYNVRVQKLLVCKIYFLN